MTYAAEVLTDLPTFYLRLGETSGTVAADSSGNGNDWIYSVDKSLMNASGLLTGDANGAALIADPTHYVKSPVGASYFASGFSTFTFEIIVNVAVFGVNGQFFGSTLANPFFACQADGSWAFDSSFVSLNAPSPLSASTRYHLCATYDGTDAILYRTAVNIASQNVPGSAEPPNPTDVWEVGYDSDTGAGVYDEAAFYDHALTPTRVAAHVAAIGGPTVSSLTPATGDIAGGIPVVVAGAHLLGASDVTFGGTSAASFVVDNDSQITAVNPPHAAGTVTVAVVA